MEIVNYIPHDRYAVIAEFAGRGYLNAPHLDVHRVNPTTGRPLDPCPPGYRGYKWFTRKLTGILMDDEHQIDMGHLIENVPRGGDYEKIHAVFGIINHTPTYLGFCSQVMV